MQEARVFGRHVLQSVELGKRRDLTAEECGEVPRDARILRIRQAELCQAGSRPAHRPRRGIDLREEAVENRLREFRASQFGADRAANQFRSAARHDQRHCIRTAVGQQGFLGRATRIGECAQLPRIGLRSLGGQLAR